VLRYGSGKANRNGVADLKLDIRDGSSEVVVVWELLKAGRLTRRDVAVLKGMSELVEDVGSHRVGREIRVQAKQSQVRAAGLLGADSHIRVVPKMLRDVLHSTTDR